MAGGPMPPLTNREDVSGSGINLTPAARDWSSQRQQRPTCCPSPHCIDRRLCVEEAVARQKIIRMAAAGRQAPLPIHRLMVASEREAGISHIFRKVTCDRTEHTASKREML